MKDGNNPASFMSGRIGEFYQIDEMSAGDIEGTESDYVQTKIEASVFDIRRELRVKILPMLLPPFSWRYSINGLECT